MSARKLKQPMDGWCAGCDAQTYLAYNDSGTLVCAQCVGTAPLAGVASNAIAQLESAKAKIYAHQEDLAGLKPNA